MWLHGFHVVGWVRVLTQGRDLNQNTFWDEGQTSGGSVMLKFCWETLGPVVHVDVILTRPDAAEQVKHWGRGS